MQTKHISCTTIGQVEKAVIIKRFLAAFFGISAVLSIVISGWPIVDVSDFVKVLYIVILEITKTSRYSRRVEIIASIERKEKNENVSESLFSNATSSSTGLWVRISCRRCRE